jgi:multiple sugar transport system ATP-binding protein
MARIVLDGVTKVFGNDVVAVDDVSLEIGDGEFMVLVGPSGCGKSTILRILAGLEEVTAGEVYIDDRQVTDLPPKARDIAMVFQNYALYPHMTVEENLGFGLKLRKVARDERSQRVRDVAQVLGLDKLMGRRPAQLSGGQRQRVAMGRAMVREPVAFLMDEPLSNLDAKLRVQMRAHFSKLHERLGTTTVFVTHDQVEAMTLGQRVAVLRDGVLQQVDTPQRLYANPVNLYVAAFIGSPPMNLVGATIQDGTVRFAGFEIPLPSDTGLDLDGREVILGIRPADLEDAAVWTGSDLPTIAVRADVTEDLGSEVNVLFAIDAPPVETDETLAANETEEDHSDFALVDERRAVFCARVDPRTSCGPGSPVRLSVDPRRFHFFDSQSGLAITPERAPVATA